MDGNNENIRTDILTENAFFEYNQIGKELDTLFETKYYKKSNRGGRFIKYIYHGYTDGKCYPGDYRPEDFRYILIDTKAMSWNLSNNINDVVKFLNLDSKEIGTLEEDIENLVMKEKSLRQSLTEKNINVDIIYERLLLVLLSSIKKANRPNPIN